MKTAPLNVNVRKNQNLKAGEKKSSKYSTKIVAVPGGGGNLDANSTRIDRCCWFIPPPYFEDLFSVLKTKESKRISTKKI